MNEALRDTPQHKPRPMVDLLVSIVIPSVILMKLSGEAHFGPHQALVLGLAFPLGWGLFELIRYRKYNFIAVLGVISVLLIGGLRLLGLDPKWLNIKEAIIPDDLGLAMQFASRP